MRNPDINRPKSFQQTIATFNSKVTSTGGGSDHHAFTVNDAVEHFGFGRTQIMLSLFVGFLWMADAMEVMILSILSPALVCEWGITSVEEALITTCVFAGMLVASTPWGSFCDQYGRRKGLIVITSLTWIFGIGSAFAPNFSIFLAMRTLTGVCIAGIPQAITYYSEFLPVSRRANCILVIEMFWALGSVFESAVALVVMEPLGWRWLLIFSGVPLLFASLFCFFIPESPRYLMISGRTEDAYQTLRKVSQMNSKDMLKGKLVDATKEPKYEKPGSVLNLFRGGLMRTTVQIWLIWFLAAFSYYGVILFTAVLFQSSDVCHGGAVASNSTGPVCKMLTHTDYIGFVFTAFAEIPGIVIVMVLIELIGRRLTMAFSFTACGLFVLLLSFCLNRTYLTLFISCCRAFAAGGFQGAFVYTPEVYPTTMRAVGLGSASGVARLGAILTPFIAQVVAKEFSLGIPPVVYGIGAVVAAIAALLLPIETKGRKMMDRIGDDV